KVRERPRRVCATTSEGGVALPRRERKTSNASRCGTVFVVSARRVSPSAVLSGLCAAAGVGMASTSAKTSANRRKNIAIVEGITGAGSRPALLWGIASAGRYRVGSGHAMAPCAQESLMSEYKATILWQRQPDEKFSDVRFSRGHRWILDGLELPASSSPHVVRLPMSVAEAIDPEEALVASLSSCHM